MCHAGIEEGKLKHKGRDGMPVAKVMGDEAVPNVVGFTGRVRNEGKDDTCAWVLKVVHLGLDEVSGLLQKINQDKRAADRANGKREIEFFLPNGSNIFGDQLCAPEEGGS